MLMARQLTQRRFRQLGALALFLGIVLLPLAVDAQTFDSSDPLGSKKIPASNLYAKDIRNLLPKAINWLLALAAVLALLALVVGGLQYIISFGEEAKAARAKKIILYAIAGLLFIGISFALITTINTFISDAPASPPS